MTIAADASLAPFLRAHEAELASLLIVSQVTLAESVEGRAFDHLTVAIAPANGERCARCWCYTTERGLKPAHAELCPKCTDAVTVDYPAGVPALEEGTR